MAQAMANSGLTQEAFDRVVAALAHKFHYCYLAGIDEISLAAFTPGIDLSSWEAGWLFGPEAALRWRKEEKGYKAMVLGEDLTGLRDTADWLSLVLDDYQAMTRQYYLWGTRQPGERIWLETRIPRSIVYPVSGSTGRRLKITVVEYLNRRTGIREFYRFQGFEEVE